MWRLFIALLLFATVTLGQSLSGWKNGKEYTYKIKSCTLASFNRQAKHFSGIVMKGRFHVQSSEPETLRARISQAQYASIHSQLDVDWDSEIPCDHMDMKNFSLSDKPFEIKIIKGIVRALIVDKNLSTWEINIVKSIVGQLQLDIEHEKLKKLEHIHSETKQPYAWYETMEDSVGGKCKVLYNISIVPACLQQTTPELYSIPELGEQEDFIEITKTKDYGNCDQKYSHHYEFSGYNDWIPDNNDIEKYFSRSSRSRIMVSGDVSEYTIRSSITLNKVLMNPIYENQDHPGMIYSKMETSLLKVNDIQIRMQSPSDSEYIENLAYDYNDSFKKESLPRESHYAKSQKGKNKESWRDGDDFYEITSRLHSKDMHTRFEETSTDLPDLSNQFTPFSIGNYKYLTTKNKINSVRYAESIAREIGNETIQFDNVLEKNILDKFNILSKIICLMNANEINEVHQILYEPSQSGPLSQEQKARRNTWTVFRDAVAQAGNEPALYSIGKWIKEKKIMGNDAAKVIDSMAKTTRTPTPKYLDTFLEILKFKEINDQPLVYDHAHQSYADLLYHTVVNKAGSDARYPMSAFGKFYDQNIHSLHNKYFPYMSAELQHGFDKKDNIKIQALISAIGRTGHPRMVSMFEPYIEGKKNATPYERFLMVISMRRLANDYADMARSVLYNIYSNVDDYYEIRTAAVYLLMQTQPPVKILQRMANFTNYDANKQVSSAVKSSIEWLASYQIGNDVFRNAAEKAIPLLTPQIYGSQYSRGVFIKATDGERKGMGLEAYYIGSDDSIIPKGVFVTIYLHKDDIKMPKIQMAATVSQIQDLWDLLQKQLGVKELDSENAEKKKYSPENISKIFGINGDKPQLLEGFMSFTDAFSTRFASVSDSEKTGYSEEQVNNLLIDLPQTLRRLRKDLSRGIDFDDTSMTNNEMTMSFPMETGYPLLFALKTSKISKVTGQCSGQIESYYDDQSTIPKSANISAKMHIIYGMNMQKHLSFITPFDDQEYISGIDQNMQLYLPFEVEVGYSKIKQEARLKFQPNTEKPQFKMLQVKVEPFTSKHNIVSLKPISDDINTRIIFKNVTLPLQVDLNYNKQSLRFRWATLENQLVLEKNEQLKNQMALQAARKMASAVASMHLTVGEDTEYQTYSVSLSGGDTHMEIKASYDTLIKDFIKSNEEKVNQEHEVPKKKFPSFDKNMTEIQCKQKLLTRAVRNITSAKAYAIDVSLKIEGDFQGAATLAAASARSNVDEKARTLLYASAKIPKSEDYFISAAIESESPNFRTMDYEETLKADSEHKVVAVIKYGKRNNEDKAVTLKFNGTSNQSENFKEQIKSSRQARECMAKTSHTGNKLIPACMKANDHAFLMNVGDYDITFENKSLLQTWAIQYLESRPRFIPHSRSKGLDTKENNKITLNYEIFPDKRVYTVNIITSNGRITESTPIPPSLLYHWDEYTEVNEERESLETAMAPYLTCALDKTQIRTFDNYRYDTRLGQCWHVAMTTFPKNDYFRPGHQKRIPENKHVTILIRVNEDGHKELKITVGDKEVELSSQGNHTIEATVDNEKIDLSNKYGWQENQTGEIGLQIFELPDKSVKLISERYEVKVTFDGFRAMIKVGDKYRASVRGLCGDNNGEPANDLKTPKGCLLEKPMEFTATYALINDEHCLGPARRIAEVAKQSKCIDDVAHPGPNVISDNDAGRKHHDNRSIGGEKTEYKMD